jgi:adenine phosphoribosyltransferase
VASVESLAVDLRGYIRDVPDFPQQGIMFRDITPLLGNPRALGYAIDLLCDDAERREASVIVGIESRGFLFGAPMADRMNLPFVPLRKPGKLPADRWSVEYSLEYGSSQLDIHRDALSVGRQAYVVDDLLATGGTAEAATRLVEMAGGEVRGLGFVIELVELGGRGRVGNYKAMSLIRY